MKKLTIDFETRSCADLKKFGAARYAQDPTTEVICLALKWHGQDPVLWYSPNFRSGVRSVSDDTVKQMVSEADILEAHNAGFEVFIWKYVMPRYGFAMFDVKKLRCSLAKAAMYGLPRSLEQACEALGVAQQKDKEGSRLMMRLCKPRRALKQDKLNDPDWETRTYWYGTPEEFARLGEYCMQDVRAEESLSSRLPDLPEAEQKVWQLDLAINDRGVRVDAEAAQAVLDCNGVRADNGPLVSGAERRHAPLPACPRRPDGGAPRERRGGRARHDGEPKGNADSGDPAVALQNLNGQIHNAARSEDGR